jgi:hypothetical protein
VQPPVLRREVAHPSVVDAVSPGVPKKLAAVRHLVSIERWSNERRARDVAQRSEERR